MSSILTMILGTVLCTVYSTVDYNYVCRVLVVRTSQSVSWL